MNIVWRAVLAGAAFVSLGASAARAEWVLHTSDTYKFSAFYPAEPKEDSTNENGVALHTVAAGDSNALCLVVTALYPDPFAPDDELKASRDNFAKGVEAQVTSSQRTTFARGSKSLPSLEFDAASATHHFRSIIVVDGQRAYQVAGGVPKNTGEADLERCVRGFKLTAK